MLHLIRFLQAHPIHDNLAQFSVIWQGGLQWGGVTAAAPGRDPLSDSGVRCGAGVLVTLVPNIYGSAWQPLRLGFRSSGGYRLGGGPSRCLLVLQHPSPWSLFLFLNFLHFLYASKQP